MVAGLVVGSGLRLAVAGVAIGAGSSPDESLTQVCVRGHRAHSVATYFEPGQRKSRCVRRRLGCVGLVPRRYWTRSRCLPRSRRRDQRVRSVHSKNRRQRSVPLQLPLQAKGARLSRSAFCDVSLLWLGTESNRRHADFQAASAGSCTRCAWGTQRATRCTWSGRWARNPLQVPLLR